jgi:hypothetical protein
MTTTQNEIQIPQPHKGIITVVFLALIAMGFKLFNTGQSSQNTAQAWEQQYPGLYCRFHPCPPCSPDRIQVQPKGEVIFQLQRTCIQWVLTPPATSHFDNLSDLSHVVHWVDSGGFHAVSVLPHQADVDLTGKGCSTRGCEIGVSGDGKFRVQMR